MSDSYRVVRVPLAVSLIRQMDRLVLGGAGGFASRTEFIQEAVDAMVLEHTYPEAAEPADQRRGNGTMPARAGANMAPRPVADTNDGRALEIRDTAIRGPARGYTVQAGIADIVGALMFGLHNRDYPSIWAASRIAARTADSPMEIDSLLNDVVNEAWEYARKLASLERRISGKLTALFPTNESKQQTASSAFLSFAVGGCHINPHDGRVIAKGPLFEWGVLQVEKRDGYLVAGVTASGHDLLNALEGISLDLPHTEEMGRRFVEFLKRSAPADWRGFELVLAGASDGDTRPELIDRFCNAHSAWDARKAGNFATGYVARAREWGLLHPKLVNHQYQLTEFGRRLLEPDGGQE